MPRHTLRPPLGGINVIDFSENLPGPYTTRLLTDLGAKVTKVERPSGDPALELFPALYEAVNAGKDILRTDLKDPVEQRRIVDLASHADVVVEGFRPGVAERLGIDYQCLTQDNSRLIYASITGYGQNGPLRDMPGHDINYLAETGVLDLGGNHLPGLPIGDLAGAMFAVNAILAAVLTRERSGRGQYLDVAISDSLIHWMLPRFAAIAGGELTGAEDLAKRPGYGVFKTSDGEHVALAAMEDHFWKRLTEFPEFSRLTAPPYDRVENRKAHSDGIKAILEEGFATATAEEWLARLAQADIPANLVKRPLEVLDALTERSPVSRAKDGFRTRFPVPMAGCGQVAETACN